MSYASDIHALMESLRRKGYLPSVCPSHTSATYNRFVCDACLAVVSPGEAMEK